ncbi:MAG: AmmeMemoRadiSam system protein B [Candidatus Bathyarchaeota archaeon]|nr:AmmeMemoRadiSam system protein B [Candidatus Bathyarchaeum tardum]WGM89586.1 MAG: AmmeMemoRadiSam system protein B [Candidatus Bathyarchaeum tardum]WNZ30311.1 MAG: AmmeMemoRadiSam system protein B [Candidatus Bathyarchaeota archaeon]
MKLRYPAVAGSWYAGTPDGLNHQIQNLFTHKLGPGSLPLVMQDGPRIFVSLIVPHAGYMASGPVAAHAYYHLAFDGKPDVIVILGPNHTGLGSAISLMNEGAWRTPLGDVPIDTQIANEILQNSDVIDIDDRAHLREHSIEMQLPFLQYLYGSEFKFVPICFMMQDLDTSREVGKAVAAALKNKNGLVIASTDLSHYEPQSQAEKKDKLAIDAALEMNEEKYYRNVDLFGISTCGYGPTVAAITAAKKLGAKNSNLLCYGTSGDVLGDKSAVVGYTSISFSK